MKRILLTNGMSAKVDDDCFEFLNRWKWRPIKNDKYPNCIYAGRAVGIGGKSYVIFMHSVVSGLPTGIMIDHKDRDPLNNQSSNIRRCNGSQNQGNQALSRHNKSGFKGVCFHRKTEKWQATLNYTKKGKKRTFYLGLYLEPKLAAAAYDKKAIEYWGEFAATNKRLGLL